MASNNINDLVSKIENLFEINGFENVKLKGLSFNGQSTNKVETSQREAQQNCRLERDPNTGRWRLVCD